MVTAAGSDSLNQTSSESIMRKSSAVAIIALSLAANLAALPAHAEPTTKPTGSQSSGSGSGSGSGGGKTTSTVVIAIIAVLIS